MTQLALDVPITAGAPAAVPLIAADVAAATPPAVAAPAPAVTSPVAQPAAPAVEKPVVAPDPRLAAQEAELAYHRREAANRTLRDKAIAYKEQLETDGWPTELATIQTKTWLEKEMATSERDTAAAQYEEVCREAVAVRLGQQYGVSPEALLVYHTAREMFAGAERLGNEGKQIAALKAELAVLKGGRVPAQTFDNGQGAPGSSDDVFIVQYSQGQSQDHARAKKLLGL